MNVRHVRPVRNIATTTATLTASVAVLAAGLTVGAAPAQAADGRPVITKPAEGTSVTWRYDGPYTVDMSVAPAAHYRTTLFCFDQDGSTTTAVSVGDEFDWDGVTNPIRTFDSNPLPGATTHCQWEIRKSTYQPGGWYAVWSNFTVDPAPDPRIVTPTGGVEVANGYTGPFTVDLSTALPGDYTAHVACFSDRWDYNAELARFTWDGTTNPTRTFTATDPMPTAPECTFSANRITQDGANDVYGNGQFSVDEPAVRVRQVTQTPGEFYPLVRDGYRDTTVTSFSLSRAATVTFTVRDSAGRVVNRRVTTMAAGSRSWTWNGRDSDARVVSPGTYRITVAAVDDRRHRSEVTVPVKVATKIVTAKGTATLAGRAGARSASDGCHAVRWDATMELDCWGGRFAAARYSFAVPASTFQTTFAVAGFAPSSDICCDGRITKAGSRPSKTSLAVVVKVTGWRAYTVRSVTGTWWYKKRL